MATYNKFESFALELGQGSHQLHAAGHELKVYLTNNAPSASADAVVADLTGITEQNGYAAADVQNGYTESGGTGTLTCVDVVWTASGGNFGPFRYVVLMNEDTAGNMLIGWWDYGSSITVLTGETFTVDFAASTLTLA